MWTANILQILLKFKVSEDFKLKLYLDTKTMPFVSLTAPFWSFRNHYGVSFTWNCEILVFLFFMGSDNVLDFWPFVVKTTFLSLKLQ